MSKAPKLAIICTLSKKATHARTFCKCDDDFAIENVMADALMCDLHSRGDTFFLPESSPYAGIDATSKNTSPPEA